MEDIECPEAETAGCAPALRPESGAVRMQILGRAGAVFLMIAGALGQAAAQQTQQSRRPESLPMPRLVSSKSEVIHLALEKMSRSLPGLRAAVEEVERDYTGRRSQVSNLFGRLVGIEQILEARVQAEKGVAVVPEAKQMQEALYADERIRAFVNALIQWEMLLNIAPREQDLGRRALRVHAWMEILAD
ncbi:MAG: hypothetical protein Greene041619_630 [Candidatus Peregrinibacteria bacterium Greene0416_19]|nr:MAG: hypothetical protein Greene041619_630 [Candidatus Peregrinibacteria bacterium Greene0416_19]